MEISCYLFVRLYTRSVPRYIRTTENDKMSNDVCSDASRFVAGETVKHGHGCDVSNVHKKKKKGDLIQKGR